MSGRNRANAITQNGLQEALTAKVKEVADEPEYHWGQDFCSFMTCQDQPVVRVGILNCTLDMDIWQGLRNPAQVGMYPIGLPDIWMHYAASNIKSTRYDGSPNPLAMAEPFEEALKRCRRAVIISGMVAMNPAIHQTYAEKIEREDLDPMDYYARARSETSAIVNKALGKLALSLMRPTRVVVPMTGKNTANIIDRTRSEYFKGRHHGPCNSHYPQNSIAVMTGLLRFGIDRLPFRDEVFPDGSVQRLIGQYASIVIFDEEDLVTDGGAGVVLLDANRLSGLRRVNDYTCVDDEIVSQRYCTYNLTKSDGSSTCAKCIESCPVAALANSSPGPDGVFPEALKQQKHRFSGDVLDFDFGNCSRDRGQKAQIYEDYVCARCEAICAARGLRKSPAEIQHINSTTPVGQSV